eukprot:3060601-Pleurochrysis_carterae.AAC.2
MGACVCVCVTVLCACAWCACACVHQRARVRVHVRVQVPLCVSARVRMYVCEAARVLVRLCACVCMRVCVQVRPHVRVQCPCARACDEIERVLAGLSCCPASGPARLSSCLSRRLGQIRKLRLAAELQATKQRELVSAGKNFKHALVLRTKKGIVPRRISAGESAKNVANMFQAGKPAEEAGCRDRAGKHRYDF